MDIDRVHQAKVLDDMVSEQNKERPFRTRAAFVVMGSSATAMVPFVVVVKVVDTVGHVAAAAFDVLETAVTLGRFERSKVRLKDHLNKTWKDMRNIVDFPSRSVALIAGVVHPKFYTTTERALARIGVTTVDLGSLQKAESDMFNMVRYVTGEKDKAVKLSLQDTGRPVF